MEKKLEAGQIDSYSRYNTSHSDNNIWWTIFFGLEKIANDSNF